MKEVFLRAFLKGGEKEFWITSSGKTHNSSCRYYGTTKDGRYSDKPSGDSCKICGVGKTLIT